MITLGVILLGAAAIWYLIVKVVLLRKEVGDLKFGLIKITRTLEHERIQNRQYKAFYAKHHSSTSDDLNELPE